MSTTVISDEVSKPEPLVDVGTAMEEYLDDLVLVALCHERESKPTIRVSLDDL